MKTIKKVLFREMPEFNDMTPNDALEEIKSLVSSLAEESDYDIDERVSDAIKRLSLFIDDVSRLDDKATIIRHVDDTTDINDCPARQMAARLLEDDDCLSPDDYYKVEDYFTSILNGEDVEMPKIYYLKCAAKQEINFVLDELANTFDIAKEIITKDCKDEFVNTVVEEVEDTYLVNGCFPTLDKIKKLVKSFLAYQEYCDKWWSNKNDDGFYKNKKPYDYSLFMSQIFMHARICKEYGLYKFRD